MGRKPRIQYYGAIYHIIQSGGNGVAVFKEDEDKFHLLKLLNETKELYDFRIFAYVLMDNHCHFLMRTFNIPISRIMHNINTKYAKYYNSKRSNIGPVFYRRYKSILVQDESYLPNIIKYIHSKPVIANICSNMEEYKWSSDVFYRLNIGNMVDIDSLLDSFSLDRKVAIEKYVELMDSKITNYKVLEDFYEKKPIIGSKAFIRRMQGAYEWRKKTLDKILKDCCPTETEYNLIKSGSRKRYLTKYKLKYIKLGKDQGYTYKQIGENIGISSTSVRKILRI
ncbi:transposase [Tepidimicrobium xylanilyticum]|uniref:REP element-mobilizing transposase RayT n=1 Tax=Tepidimicrobium xylanilyticum TaxID=1123352 RepID=A0A1H2RIP5_9FIRM|nr:transposase [Tepidimicrobium xylanilyticum]GMG95425.1 hypothetical protein EN5CB1_02510 [Tepidimicrobium xylanilyticum]SDW18509.1 REP element-mobilizing transposase RayT [Tepidimicrobium xylanilyticum]